MSEGEVTEWHSHNVIINVHPLPFIIIMSSADGASRLYSPLLISVTFVVHVCRRRPPSSLETSPSIELFFGASWQVAGKESLPHHTAAADLRARTLLWVGAAAAAAVVVAVCRGISEQSNNIRARVAVGDATLSLSLSTDRVKDKTVVARLQKDPVVRSTCPSLVLYSSVKEKIRRRGVECNL